jgi:hypothetical protein
LRLRLEALARGGHLREAGGAIPPAYSPGIWCGQRQATKKRLPAPLLYLFATLLVFLLIFLLVPLLVVFIFMASFRLPLRLLNLDS